MHVDRAVEGVERLTLDDIHQGVARHDEPGALRERQQQGELIARERARHAVEPRRARAAIDLQPAEAQDVGLRRALAPAQDGAQPRQQLARLERLGQVVVGAQLEADDAVHGVAARGQHQDRRLRAGAHAPADLEAVDIGQHQIEHQRVEGLAPVQRRVPGCRCRHG